MANVNDGVGPFTSKPEPTTAQLLGAYRRELEAEGIEGVSLSTLVVEAARQMLRTDPIVVGFDAPEGMTLLTVTIPVDSAQVKDRLAVERVAAAAALRAVEENLG